MNSTGWSDMNAAVIFVTFRAELREVAQFAFGADVISAMPRLFFAPDETASQCGVERIFWIPGWDFIIEICMDSTTRVRHQMSVFLNTFRLRALGFPICHALPHAFENFGEEVVGRAVLRRAGGPGQDLTCSARMRCAGSRRIKTDARLVKRPGTTCRIFSFRSASPARIVLYGAHPRHLMRAETSHLARAASTGEERSAETNLLAKVFEACGNA